MRIPASCGEAGPRRRREPTGPLVDVVFLLLVFFLLAGTLEPTPPIVVEPPESEHADPLAESRNGRSLRILVDAAGRMGFEGQVVDREGLAVAIRDRLSQGPIPSAQVEADSAAATGLVLALLEQLRALGLEDLRLITRPSTMIDAGDG